MYVLNGFQIKVARVAAGLTHQQLADQANVAISTVRRIEVEQNLMKSRVETLRKIIDTLKDHGVSCSCHDGKLIWEKIVLEPIVEVQT